MSYLIIPPGSKRKFLNKVLIYTNFIELLSKCYLQNAYLGNEKFN